MNLITQTLVVQNLWEINPYLKFLTLPLFLIFNTSARPLDIVGCEPLLQVYSITLFLLKIISYKFKQIKISSDTKK